MNPKRMDKLQLFEAFFIPKSCKALSRLFSNDKTSYSREVPILYILIIEFFGEDGPYYIP